MALYYAYLDDGNEIFSDSKATIRRVTGLKNSEIHKSNSGWETS